MNELEVLIDQYRQRAKEVRKMIESPNTPQDFVDMRRLATKLSCYRTFITELEIIQQNYKPMTI